MSVSEMAKKVSTMWKELDEEAKEEYSAANGVLIAEVEHLAEVEELSLANLL